MPARGRPPGKAPKLWADAIRKAVNVIDKDEKRKRLELLAERIVSSALGGDMVAMKEIGDRVDGKVPQALVGSDEHPPVVPLGKIALVPLVSEK